MKSYKDLRDEWIHLRKIKKVDKLDIDYIKQGVLGLVIDKIDKFAKKANSDNKDEHVQQAIKSELKQTLDAQKGGVQCQHEVDILTALLPQVLTQEETTGIIIAILARYEKPNMGTVMKELKTFEGIDMSIASKLAKELL